MSSIWIPRGDFYFTSDDPDGEPIWQKLGNLSDSNFTPAEHPRPRYGASVLLRLRKRRSMEFHVHFILSRSQYWRFKAITLNLN